MIAYYASGEKPIPKTVLLATEGYRMRERAQKRVGVAEKGAAFTVTRGNRTAVRVAQTGKFVSVGRAKRSSTVVERLPKPDPRRKK
jgi:hypothetical protein